MLTEIREKSVVNGGRIALPPLDLPDGTEVEVIVLVDKEQENEMDTTEYLLSTEANRKHLEQSIRDASDPDKLIYVDIDKL
jgi:predicted DNA-binding antitoxin AbrB/MazE fold protein